MDQDPEEATEPEVGVFTIEAIGESRSCGSAVCREMPDQIRGKWRREAGVMSKFTKHRLSQGGKWWAERRDQERIVMFNHCFNQIH